MPFVPVPRDLSKIRTKIVFNLSKRQLICFSLAAAVGVPTYFFTRGPLGNTGAVFLMIGLMLPFFFFAMYEKDEQPAEKILRNIVRAKWFPARRPYRTENLYQYLEMEGKALAGSEQATGAAAKKTVAKHTAGAKR